MTGDSPEEFEGTFAYKVYPEKTVIHHSISKWSLPGTHSDTRNIEIFHDLFRKFLLLEA